MINQILRYINVIFLVTTISGCGHMLDDMGLRDETVNPPAYPSDVPPPPKHNGTIYQAGYEMTLYQDRIAYRIGDILTVRLEENTQGEKRAKLKSTKLSQDSFKFPGLEKGKITGHMGDFSSDQNFNGEGESNQQNKLRGTISVTVIRVLSNGNLVIQGESWLTINQGREYVRLTGIVRREDIEANNEISSQRVANARISYSGNGQVANASRGGFITQFLFKFFPY